MNFDFHFLTLLYCPNCQSAREVICSLVGNFIQKSQTREQKCRVDLRGLEPLTFRMQTGRSSQLSYRPCYSRKKVKGKIIPYQPILKKIKMFYKLIGEENATTPSCCFDTVRFQLSSCESYCNRGDLKIQRLCGE